MSAKKNVRFDWWQRALSRALGGMLVLGLTAPMPTFGSDEEEGAHHMHHHRAAEHAMEPGSNHADHPADDGLEGIAGEADPHAHHRHMMESNAYRRSLHQYKLPDLTLVDMTGDRIRLLAEVEGNTPVMLNFIFTTCATICPVLSATFSQVEQQLGSESDGVRMISITIDPEHDTPERLRAYAARYQAGPQWQFLTGDLEDIVTVQKAFNAYRGSKMNHEPLTFLRASPEAPWVRLEGLASAADVVKEYRQLVAEQQ
jgi:protein SCO1/2